MKTGYEALGAAVLIQAIRDARHPLRLRPSRHKLTEENEWYYRQARRWFREAPLAVEFWCDVAGVAIESLARSLDTAA